MRIAVCDDEYIYQTAMTKAIELWQNQRALSSVIVECFRSTEDLLNAVENQQQFDIIFLDIQIPNGMSGMELAKRIRAFNEYTQIVFVTNYAEYACEGYHVNALRYLCKPVYPNQVGECLDIAYGQWQTMQDASIVLDDPRGKIVLMYKDILYMESRAHNLIIYRVLTEEPCITRMTLDRMYDVLPHDLFVRCHRSFLVNILYIRRIIREGITLANGQEIVIGKKYRDLLVVTFDRYYQGIHI